MREACDRVVTRIEPADFSAAAREIRLVIAVEMVGVMSFRLKLPRHLRAGQSPRKEERVIVCPGDEVRATATACRIAVRGSEPHGTPLCQNPLFRSIRPAHANVGPIVPRIEAGLAILIRQPLAIRRPTRAEVEVATPARDLDSPAAH